jgi:hypothetical protein
MAFYFITFTTAAWGYALLAWLAEILRQEPEARSLLVGMAVTLVCKSKASQYEYTANGQILDMPLYHYEFGGSPIHRHIQSDSRWLLLLRPEALFRSLRYIFTLGETAGS